MKTILLVIIILLSYGCNVFDKDETLLAEHIKINGEKVQIYYVGLGATTNDVIQVKKANEEKILWVTDKYNYIQSSKLISDTSLQLVLSDTGYHNYNNKSDTIIINVK